MFLDAVHVSDKAPTSANVQWVGCPRGISHSGRRSGKSEEMDASGWNSLNSVTVAPPTKDAGVFDNAGVSRETSRRFPIVSIPQAAAEGCLF